LLIATVGRCIKSKTQLAFSKVYFELEDTFKGITGLPSLAHE